MLLATHGQHSFFMEEGKQVRDLRRCPLRFEGYSIGCRRGRDGLWHASVRIERACFAELKRQFERLAVHRTVEELASALRAIPYERYAPVRDQLRVRLALSVTLYGLHTVEDFRRPFSNIHILQDAIVARLLLALFVGPTS